MKYCVNLICQNRKQLRRELLSDIQAVFGEQITLIDEDMIRQKLDAIEEKKQKSFDAMLEGMLTEGDLKKQIEWYDDELSRLQMLIEENEQNNKQYSRQKEQIDDLEKTLDEILSFREDNEMLYREILEKIVVYGESQRGCNRLVVWFRSLPFGIRLKIRSAGVGEEYHTEVLELEFVQ